MDTELWDAGRVRWEAEQIHRRFNVLRERVIWRRMHYNNDDLVNPRLGEYGTDGKPVDGNPFVSLNSYQSDRLRHTAQEMVPKLCENPTLVEAKPEKESSVANPIANNLAQVFQIWLDAIQNRTGEPVGQAISYGQVRDCYGILHTRRVDDVWPEIPYLWTDTLPPDPQEAKTWIPYTDVQEFDDPQEAPCPDCNGTGIVSDGDPYIPTHSVCEGCDGNQTILQGPKGKGAYRETDAAYTKRVAEIRASAGPAWTLEFPDPEQFSFTLDRDPRGGLARAVWVFEVGYLDYMAASEVDEQGPTSMDADARDAAGIGREQPAPGMVQSLGFTNVPNFTLSSPDWMKRCRVIQLWTRDAFYEIYEPPGGAAKDSELRKAFLHDYGRVPFWIVPAHDGFQRDPVNRYEPYLEGLFRIKPFLDRQLTLVGGMSELTAMPIMYYTQNANGMAPQLPDGNPQEEQSNSVGGTALPQGMGITTVPMNLTNGVAAFLMTLRQQEKEITPSTGIVSVEAQTQPWTARQMMAQANVGPSVLVENRRRVIQDCMNLWKDWHQRHPAEIMYARVPGAAGKIVSVDPKEIANIKISVAISKIGSAEQIAYMQTLLELYKGGFIKAEDFYRDGMAIPNPHDYQLSLQAENVAKPYKDAYLTAKLAQAMGAEFLLGVNGQTLDSKGGQATPGDALAANGWQVPQGMPSQENPAGLQAPTNGGGQQTPQGQGQAGINGGGAQMPQLAPLQAPGTLPLPGQR